MSYYSTIGYSMAPLCRNILGKKPDITKIYGITSSSWGIYKYLVSRQKVPIKPSAE